jgi:hypothetical protein
MVLALQIQPELRAVAKIAAKVDGRIGGDRTAAVQDNGDAAGRHANIQRKPIALKPRAVSSRFNGRPGWAAAIVTLFA